MSTVSKYRLWIRFDQFVQILLLLILIGLLILFHPLAALALAVPFGAW
jgi:hypothetical protein